LPKPAAIGVPSGALIDLSPWAAGLCGSAPLAIQGASFKTPHFGRSLRWAQISILEIRPVFLRLKSSPALTSAKLKRFEIGSKVIGLNGFIKVAIK
jgi:hypothetical protein